MEVYIQALQVGLTNGAIYAMFALAINIVYSTTLIINFAHAEVVMFSAMIGYTFVSRLGLPYIPSFILICISTACVSVLLYLIAIKPFGKKLHNSLGWILTTLGIGIVLSNIAIKIWGSAPHAFPKIGGDSLVTAFGIRFYPHDIYVILIILACALLLSLFMEKTMIGTAIKGVQYNHDITRLMGINAEMIIMICFALSGVVAGIAGALVAPITFVYPSMAASVGLKGFGASVIGGLGNNRGAFVGGLILGLLEAFALGVLGISAGYRSIITFVILIAIMIIRPQGIMGRKIFEKV